MEGKMSSNKVLWKGTTNFGSSFNATLHIHKFSHVFKPLSQEEHQVFQELDLNLILFFVKYVISKKGKNHTRC